MAKDPPIEKVNDFVAIYWRELMEHHKTTRNLILPVLQSRNALKACVPTAVPAF